jgi:hypothetical protein
VVDGRGARLAIPRVALEAPATDGVAPIQRVRCSGNAANGGSISTALCGQHRAIQRNGQLSLMVPAKTFGGLTIRRGRSEVRARNADAR